MVRNLDRMIFKHHWKYKQVCASSYKYRFTGLVDVSQSNPTTPTQSLTPEWVFKAFKALMPGLAFMTASRQISVAQSFCSALVAQVTPPFSDAGLSKGVAFLPFRKGKQRQTSPSSIFCYLVPCDISSPPSFFQ